MEQHRLTKKACYLTGITMAITSNLSPILFLTFREMYDLSFTLLGLLVVFNFVTQLSVDLIFTFFTKYFNIHKTVKTTPFVAFFGLIIYAVLPKFFPDSAFLWIATGTVICSVGSGLAEVLISPVIAAIPSENPEREMSKLHSMYAWGVVGVTILSTLFLLAFGSENWMYLALCWSIIPLTAFLMFSKTDLPAMQSFGDGKKQTKIFKKGIILCAVCLFFGGAAECTMGQWSSSFIENAIGIPKVYGDIIGVALLAALMGTGRTLYAKYGKKIENVLLFGMLGAGVCYLTASLSLNPVIGVTACVLTGIFVSMLWPGTLIYLEEKYTHVGVAVYALMAAGGDMGAAVAPQMVGILSDKFSLSELAIKISETLHIGTEQVGMRAGLLVAALFPIAGAVCVLCMKKHFKNRDKKQV
ncbi:MAG: MFS transporter [Clostridia bacterium]|nr:MFS transporter [Clostridia bacterium]